MLTPAGVRNQPQTAMPTLDVSSTCHAESNTHLADEQDYSVCMRNERQARDQLLTTWSSYSRKIRARCTVEATLEGSPSYVDLFECMEMAKYAAQVGSQGNVLDMTTSPLAPGAIKRKEVKAPGRPRAGKQNSPTASTIHIPSGSELDRAQAINPKVLSEICQGC